MRILIFLTFVLNTIQMLGQQNPIDDVYDYLNEHRKDLVFSFSVNDSKQVVVLTNSKDNEVIIDVLFKNGLLNYHSAFLESESNTAEYQNKSATNVLAIRADISKSNKKFDPLLIFVPDHKMTKKLFNEIETELKRENLFDFY